MTSAAAPHPVSLNPGALGSSHLLYGSAWIQGLAHCWGPAELPQPLREPYSFGAQVEITDLQNSSDYSRRNSSCLKKWLKRKQLCSWVSPWERDEWGQNIFCTRGFFLQKFCRCFKACHYTEWTRVSPEVGAQSRPHLGEKYLADVGSGHMCMDTMI